jgi:hypothetical protein
LPTLEQPYVRLPDGILLGRRSEVYRRNFPAIGLTGYPTGLTGVDVEALRQLPLHAVGSGRCQQDDYEKKMGEVI